MFKNKKGFTLIELLAVIVILALLVGIAIPAISSQLVKFSYDYYDSSESSVLSAGEEYLSDKRFSMPTELLHSNTVTINELVEAGYIDEVVDYNVNTCGGYVVVVKVGEDEYDYQACLECGDEYSTINSDSYKEELNNNLASGNNNKKDYCNAAWKSNDEEYFEEGWLLYNVSYDETAGLLEIAEDPENPGEQKVTVVYNVPQTTVEKYVGMVYSVYKKSSDGEILFTIEEGEVIYPNNLSALVNQTYSANNIVLYYELPTGVTEEIKAEVRPLDSVNISIAVSHAKRTAYKQIGDTYEDGDIAGALKFELSAPGYRATISKYQYSIDNGNTWVEACSASGNACEFTFSDGYDGIIQIRAANEDGSETAGVNVGTADIIVDTVAPVCTVTITHVDSFVTTDNDTSAQETLVVNTSDATIDVTFNVDCEDTYGINEEKIKIIANSGSGTTTEVSDGETLSITVGDIYVVTPVGVDIAKNTSNSESAMLEANTVEVISSGSVCERTGKDKICWAATFFNAVEGQAFADITSGGKYDFDVSSFYFFTDWECYTGTNKSTLWFSNYNEGKFYRYRCWEGSACYNYLAEKKASSSSSSVKVGDYSGYIISCGG